MSYKSFGLKWQACFVSRIVCSTYAAHLREGPVEPWEDLAEGSVGSYPVYDRIVFSKGIPRAILRPD